MNIMGFVDNLSKVEIINTFEVLMNINENFNFNRNILLTFLKTNK